MLPQDGRKDGHWEIPPCVLQDIGPLGPLPKKENQLPKGNMWSVISVALPRLIVNLSEGEQGSGPQGKFPHL